MTGTILIAAAMVAIVVLPAILFTASAKRQVAKRRTEMKQVFEKLVANHQLAISRHDELRNMTIAIDELKMLLLFIRHDNDRVSRQLVPLTHVAHCTVERVGNTLVQVKKNGKSNSIENVNEIRLALTLMDNTTTHLPIYMEAQDGVYEKLPLAELADKWQTHISQSLITGLRNRA